MGLNKIKQLLRDKRYDEARAQCVEWRVLHPEDMVEILRITAESNYLQRRDEDSFDNWMEIINSGKAVLKDYYLAGNSAINISRFDDAEYLFQKVIALGKEQSDEWFSSAALFLLAYSKMYLGKFDEALLSLDEAAKADSECAMPLPGYKGLLTHNQLRQEILRRS